jgi:hypothetical protein
MKIKPRLDRSEIGLAAVGSGSVAHARQFVGQTGFRGEMFVDPRLQVYRAFGLHRGVRQTLGLAAILKGFAAMRRGFRQGSTAGDLWQQGGLFAIDPQGRTIFAHRDRFAGDHANLEQVAAALNF